MVSSHYYHSQNGKTESGSVLGRQPFSIKEAIGKDVLAAQLIQVLIQTPLDPLHQIMGDAEGFRINTILRVFIYERCMHQFCGPF